MNGLIENRSIKFPKLDNSVSNYKLNRMSLNLSLNIAYLKSNGRNRNGAKWSQPATSSSLIFRLLSQTPLFKFLFLLNIII